jgi:DNA-binding transcriptional MerR regulator
MGKQTPIFVRMCNAKEVLGVSPDTIRRYEEMGLRVHRVGQRVSSIRVADYEAFVLEQSQARGADRGANCD